MVDENELILPDGTLAPAVALDEMNRVHADELALIRQLLEALDARRDEAGDLADQWLEHTRAHFDNEKRLMESVHFPPMPIHVAEHDQVWLQMRSQIEAYHQGGDAAELAGWIRQVWSPWFVQHVNSMDMVTARFIQQRREST